MTEYIVIVGIIAILAIGAVEKFSKQLETTYNRSSDAIARRVSGPIGKARGGKGGLALPPSGSASMGGDGSTTGNTAVKPAKPDDGQ